MRILEVESNGSLTLPAEALGHVEPHTRYVLESQRGILMLRPEAPDNRISASKEKQLVLAGEWEQERNALTEDLGKAWPEGVSVDSVFAEMRR